MEEEEGKEEEEAVVASKALILIRILRESSADFKLFGNEALRLEYL